MARSLQGGHLPCAVLRTVGEREWLCRSERRLWGSGCSGHREPSSLAMGEGTPSWGPDWGGPAELGCGELRVGSAPCAVTPASIPQAGAPQGTVCPCSDLLSSSKAE